MVNLNFYDYVCVTKSRKAGRLTKTVILMKTGKAVAKVAKE